MQHLEQQYTNFWTQAPSCGDAISSCIFQAVSASVIRAFFYPYTIQPFYSNTFGEIDALCLQMQGIFLLGETGGVDLSMQKGSAG